MQVSHAITHSDDHNAHPRLRPVSLDETIQRAASRPESCSSLLIRSHAPHMYLTSSLRLLGSRALSAAPAAGRLAGRHRLLTVASSGAAPPTMPPKVHCHHGGAVSKCCRNGFGWRSMNSACDNAWHIQVSLALCQLAVGSDKEANWETARSAVKVPDVVRKCSKSASAHVEHVSNIVSGSSRSFCRSTEACNRHCVLVRRSRAAIPCCW